MSVGLDIIAYDLALLRAHGLARDQPQEHDIVTEAARLFMAEIDRFDEKSMPDASMAMVAVVLKSIGGFSIRKLAETGKFPAIDDASRALVYNVLLQVAIAHYENKLKTLKTSK